MKRQRISLVGSIEITGAISVIYLISVVGGAPLVVMLCLLGLAFAATVWMVLRILKDPYATDKTFDEQFYQDRDDLRRCGPEEKS
jgi:hypothetical protein